jgi:hypothetical protein
VVTIRTICCTVARWISALCPHRIPPSISNYSYPNQRLLKLYSINRLSFVTEGQDVFCCVGNYFLYKRTDKLCYWEELQMLNCRSRITIGRLSFGSNQLKALLEAYYPIVQMCYSAHVYPYCCPLYLLLFHYGFRKIVNYAWRAELYTGFWWGNLRERDYLEDPDNEGRIILR